MARTLLLMLALLAGAAEAVTETITASGTWTAPAGVTSVTVEAWGAGGGGGGQNQGSDGGGGGGGGAYSSAVVAVVPGVSYTVTVGGGGAGQTGGIGTCGTAGGPSWFGSVATVLAAGGEPGCGSTGMPPPGGAGGAATASVGTTKFDGGNGGIGRNSTPSGQGGPGGSSAGTAGAGTSGGDPWTTMVAAPPPAGGGIGGDGGDVGLNGNPPASGYGGGGGGSGEGTSRIGGSGANGLVIVTYTVPASVLSIDCVGACTTGAASVSWTVTFSESVAGVTSGNFQLVNSGLGGTPAITSVAGGGAVWTVTASTGTGSGTLGLNMVNTTGVTPALSYLPFTGQTFNIDRTAPAVSSITRVGPSPTALASVSWTVIFSESVTGVDAADFALVQAGGVNGAAITAVSGGGTTWTVTAGTGAGNGLLRLDLVDNDSIIDVMGNMLGGAGAGNGNSTGETYSIAKPVTVTRSPTACASVADIGYTAAWSVLTGPLVSDNAYAIASVDGTATHFLQCTGYGFTIPSSATINGITVNVERNSNSTGNGGSKDAAMRVVKGGVIGIADRATATVYGTGDVSEAHGGATDLWGTTWAAADINASDFGAAFAATKADPAGQPHTVSVDHISISISYTSPAAVISIDCASACTTNAASVSWAVTFSESVAGLTAANFVLVNTGLSGTPVITSVSGSGTIWTVTASTGIGSGTLGLDMVNTSGVAPALTNLPFTGQVYTVDRTMPVVSSIARVDPTPTALASVSWTVAFSESVTGVDITDFVLVQAGGASGAAITSVAGGGTSYTVTASTGTGNGTLGLNLVDDDTVIDAVSNSLGGAGAGNGNFTGEIYTLNFTAPSFVFTNAPCVHNIAFGAPGQTCAQINWSLPQQVAGQDRAGIYITAVSASGVPYRLHASQVSTRNIQFGLTCHNPVADAGVAAAFAGAANFPVCQPNGGTPVTWSAAVTVTFNPGIPSSAASYVFNYADVGSVELWMRNSATPAQVGYSGPFVVKPGGFVLSGIQQTAAPNTPNPAAANAAGAKFVRAGEAFSVTVTAATCSPASAVCTVAGAATPNYGKEAVAESVKLTSTLAAGLGLTNNPAIVGTFGAFANGVATGAAFVWNEVGIITLTPSVTDADYLGAGDVAGTTTGNVGRFYAAQIALSGAVIANRTGLGGVCAAPAGCDTFTYMGEEMSAVFNLTAQAADGVTVLQNYDAAINFARLDPSAAGNPLALAAVDTGVPRTVVVLDAATYGAATGSFVNGVASVTAPFAVARVASPSGPFDALVVGVAPVDGDGAALATLDLAVNAGGAPNTHGMIGSTRTRYGRMKLASAHGSELLALPVNVTAQFWNGATYDINILDNNSTFAAADVLFSNYRNNLAAGETGVITPPASVTFANGVAGFRLSRPGAGNNGSVDMTVNIISAWLPGNTARATFGVYKGSNEFIYLREVY